MNDRARRVRHRGVGMYRDEAEKLLAEPGDVAAIVRERVRSLLMKCPDGCGETLVVNLDERAGKAWSMDVRNGSLSLFPSVWLEHGCKSHFIVWSDRIVWCDFSWGKNDEPRYDVTLEERVLTKLNKVTYEDPVAIARSLEEIPWDVLRCCLSLSKAGSVLEGVGKQKGRYRKN